MWLVTLTILLIFGYSLFYRIQLKKYNESHLVERHQDDLKEQLICLLMTNHIDSENMIIVNGHFLRKTIHLWSTTTYYSYVILLSSDSPLILLYSYSLRKNQLIFINAFSSQQIEIKYKSDIQINLAFWNENKNLVATVHVDIEPIPQDSCNQIKFPQKEEVNFLLKKIEGVPV